MKEDTGKYPVRCFRLHPETYRMLKFIKDQTGKSWNKVFFDLLEGKK